MTTESTIDATGAPPVRSSAWLGRCSGCGVEISRQKAPPPCHVKRMKCKKCKHETHMKHARAWAKKNKKYERDRKQMPHRKAMALEGNLARNRRSQSKATMTRQPWGIVEDCWLLENAGKMTEIKLGEHLGRSMRSIEMRLWRLRRAERPNDKLRDAPPKTPELE